MGKVAEKIIEEAREKKEKAIEDARKKADSIIEEAKKKAEKIKEKSQKNAGEAKKKEIDRLVSRARMEMKTEKLKVKNDVIERLKEDVKEKINNLKWKEYSQFLKDLILDLSISKDEEVIPGNLYRDKIDELVQKINSEEGTEFKVKDEDGNFKIGVILKKGDKKINGSFNILLDEALHDIEGKITEIIFRSE